VTEQQTNTTNALRSEFVQFMDFISGQEKVSMAGVPPKAKKESSAVTLYVN
jgi:hypothetical protein